MNSAVAANALLQHESEDVGSMPCLLTHEPCVLTRGMAEWSNVMVTDYSDLWCVVVIQSEQLLHNHWSARRNSSLQISGRRPVEMWPKRGLYLSLSILLLIISLVFESVYLAADNISCCVRLSLLPLSRQYLTVDSAIIRDVRLCCHHRRHVHTVSETSGQESTVYDIDRMSPRRSICYVSDFISVGRNHSVYWPQMLWELKTRRRSAHGVIYQQGIDQLSWPSGLHDVSLSEGWCNAQSWCCLIESSAMCHRAGGSVLASTGSQGVEVMRCVAE